MRRLKTVHIVWCLDIWVSALCGHSGWGPRSFENQQSYELSALMSHLLYRTLYTPNLEGHQSFWSTEYVLSCPRTALLAICAFMPSSPECYGPVLGLAEVLSRLHTLNSLLRHTRRERQNFKLSLAKRWSPRTVETAAKYFSNRNTLWNSN